VAEFVCRHVVLLLLLPAGGVAAAADYPLQPARVSGWHIGCYAFKGCGMIDMVAFTCQQEGPPHPVCQDSMQQQQGGSVQQLLGKGMLLVQRSGPVVGLQSCPVLLPDVLPVLQEAWGAAAEVAAHARPRSSGGGGQQQQPYALW
jgi:hypothetical protein